MKILRVIAEGIRETAQNSSLLWKDDPAFFIFNLCRLYADRREFARISHKSQILNFAYLFFLFVSKMIYKYKYSLQKKAKIEDENYTWIEALSFPFRQIITPANHSRRS